VATAPTPLKRDAQVEDQGSAASLFSQVISDFHVAAPLARAGRDVRTRPGRAVRTHAGCGPCVQPTRQEERAEHRDHPIVRLG
jgi:hypothetical protein